MESSDEPFSKKEDSSAPMLLMEIVYSILQSSQVFWKNVTSAYCFNIVVTEHESIFPCIQSDLYVISSPLKYVGRGIK